jgi:TRAP-type uncharacterized transport system substrate-binding protein
MGGFAKVLHDKMGITASVEVTGGPVHNTQLVETNQLEIGGLRQPSHGKDGMEKVGLKERSIKIQD